MPTSDYFRPMQGVKQIELAISHLDAIIESGKMSSEEQEKLKENIESLGQVQKWLWESREVAKQEGIELRPEEKEIEQEIEEVV